MLLLVELGTGWGQGTRTKAARLLLADVPSLLKMGGDQKQWLIPCTHSALSFLIWFNKKLLMNGYAIWGLIFIETFRSEIILRFFIRLHFEIYNKIKNPFFVTTSSSLLVIELAEKNTFLAYTLLIYNKLLRHECMWILENNLFFSCNM